MSSNDQDWDGEEREAFAPIRDELEVIRRRHRSDPPIGLLRAAQADVLPDAVGDAATEHLERSAWSRALLDGANEAADGSFDAASRRRIRAEIQRRQSSAPSSRPRLWIWAPALGLAALLIVAVSINRPSRSPAPVHSGETPQTTPTASSRTAFHLPLDKPEVKFTEAALVVRGEKNQRVRFVDAVAPGVKAYRGGDYAEAATSLAGLEAAYPRSVEVPFYLGVSRLFLSDYAGAITALQAARRVDDGSFTANIGWYLAVAEERAGRKADATGELRTICRGTSEFRSRACQAAEALERD
ncbi:MAG: tetratricopeptide repeat protein [Vicinamibacterales bacterium]